ncbi:uncharacterized protein LOC135821058 [Sycon ciliatum]|uniref:uncharacterized protein LOC135821058 n=1 Tax=Sycon ciliatum TaxID=27933 RepID=UPI0020AC172C|eukprot:scpid93613/ scgid22274/ 
MEMSVGRREKVSGPARAQGKRSSGTTIRLLFRILPSAERGFLSLHSLLLCILGVSLVTLLLLAALVQPAQRKAKLEANSLSELRAAQRKLELTGSDGDDIFEFVEKTLNRIRKAKQQELADRQDAEVAATDEPPTALSPDGLGVEHRLVVMPDAESLRAGLSLDNSTDATAGNRTLNPGLEKISSIRASDLGGADNRKGRDPAAPAAAAGGGSGGGVGVGGNGESTVASPVGTRPPFLWPYQEESELAQNFTDAEWDHFDMAMQQRVYKLNRTYFVPDTVPFRCLDSRAWTRNCYKTCASGKGRVPRLVHFMQVGDNMKFLHWLSVMSAIRFIRPDLVIVHYMGRQTTCWARRIKAHPLVVFQPMSTSLVPHALNHANISELAHQADFLRLTLLWQYGGIYMDFDALITKSFDPLMFQEAVVSYQISQEMGNGLMVSRPRSCFICGYARRACHNFDGRWTTHSVWTLTRMVRFEEHIFPEVKVLKAADGFFPFCYTPEYLDRLFNYDVEQIGFSPTQVFALHLYNKMSEHFSEKISYDWIVMQRSPVAVVSKRILPYGFQREHMDEGRCLPVPLVVPD